MRSHILARGAGTTRTKSAEAGTSIVEYYIPVVCLKNARVLFFLQTSHSDSRSLGCVAEREGFALISKSLVWAHRKKEGLKFHYIQIFFSPKLRFFNFFSPSDFNQI